MTEPFEDYNSASDPTSQSLVDAMMQGEESAWKKIAEVWGRTLLNYFGRKGLQGTDCEEVTQNVMVKMYSAMSRGKFERDGKQKRLRFWVYKIAENELKSFYERFQNKPHSPGGTEHQDILANVGTDEDTEDFKAILVAQILDVIQTDFKEDTWETFRLFHFENLSQPEIESKQGINQGAIRARIKRVKDRLQAELEAAIPALSGSE